MSEVFLLYGYPSVALILHILRMILYIKCKDKVFVPYGSSSVALNLHPLRMPLDTEIKEKVFLLYGSSRVAVWVLKFSFKCPSCENDFVH